MSPQHTPGPWRWELSMESKRLHLVGGRPQFDLTIIDFNRWGMSSATMSLRDTDFDGMNLMYKLHERPDWFKPFPGREHHKRWLQNVVHPDARLIAAAPDLLDALCALVLNHDAGGVTSGAMHDARAAIAKATGEQS